MNKIRELRAKHNIKQADLAAQINVSSAALSGYETGRYEADIETYIKIAKIFQVSLDYLLGEGDSSDAARIPVLGSVPAGIPLEAIEDVVDWEEIPNSMLAGGKEYFALRVKGDSMYPEYLDGDVVIVRRTPEWQTGDVCVAYVNGYEATLKQLRLAADGSVTLQPRNPEYPPRTYSPEEVAELPVTVAGVVVELRRKVGR